MVTVINISMTPFLSYFRKNGYLSINLMMIFAHALTVATKNICGKMLDFLSLLKLNKSVHFQVVIE